MYIILYDKNQTCTISSIICSFPTLTLYFLFYYLLYRCTNTQNSLKCTTSSYQLKSNHLHEIFSFVCIWSRSKLVPLKWISSRYLWNAPSLNSICTCCWWNRCSTVVSKLESHMKRLTDTWMVVNGPWSKCVRVRLFMEGGWLVCITCSVCIWTCVVLCTHWYELYFVE